MKIVILGTLVLGALVSCAQDEQAKAKEAFSSKFPNAKNVKWDRESDTEWEAEFKMDGKEYSANFSNDGTWMETEYEISKKDLPESIKAAIEAAYPGAKLEEIEKVEKPDFKGYEIEVEQGESMFELVFDESGTIIEKKAVSDEDDEEDDDDSK